VGDVPRKGPPPPPPRESEGRRLGFAGAQHHREGGIEGIQRGDKLCQHVLALTEKNSELQGKEDHSWER